MQICADTFASAPVKREAGEQNRQNVEAFLRSSALYPIVGRRFMSAPDFDELVRQCVQELRVLSSKTYLRLYDRYILQTIFTRLTIARYVCYGEKP